jgi:hypothetical protein
MLKKISSLALAAVFAAGVLSTTAEHAQARSRVGVGIAAGVVAGTLLGAYAYGAPRYYAARPACYKGPRQCDWAGRSCWINRWGERVCSGGEWRCWRPTICD